MEWNAKWIRPVTDTGNAAPVYAKRFTLSGSIRKARLFITALGVYEARLNGRRIGDYVPAPGWTASSTISSGDRRGISWMCTQTAPSGTSGWDGPGMPRYSPGRPA